MLDFRFIIDNPEVIKQNCRDRNVAGRAAVVDQIVALGISWRHRLQNVEEGRREQNRVAQETGRERDPDRRAELIARGKQYKEDLANMEQNLKQDELDLKERVALIPNMTHPDSPVGQTDEDNKPIKHWGMPRAFDFKPRDHVEIGKALDLIDFEAGGKVSGHGFYFLKNEGALLDLALQQFAMQALVKEGFIPVITPDLARNTILEGIGFTPRGHETQIYNIEDTDLSLVGTAEITLGGMHADEVLDTAKLPLKYAGLSHCFRTEAGAAGRASKGLYRVHQFTKVEMFAFTEADLAVSGAMHLELLRIEEEIFQALGLPYRVLDICTGDLGGPAYRKFDIEAWMPGRGEKGEYGEVTSTSDCTDYQARRLNIRYKPQGQKGTRFVHTLNGTAVAVSRALLAVLENYQRADGKVDVPPALRPWMGKDVIG